MGEIKFDRSVVQENHGDVELSHNSTAGVVEIVLWDDHENKSDGCQSISIWHGQIDDLVNLLQKVSKTI